MQLLNAATSFAQLYCLVILKCSTISSIKHARTMAAHLFKTENERVIIHDTIDGRQNRKALEGALVDMQLYTRLTNGQNGIFSVAINPRENETLTEEQYAIAIDKIEREFGLTDQMKIRVDHVKKGRAHAHVLWSTFDQENNKLINIGWSKVRSQRLAKEMVHEFNLEPVRRRANEQSVEISDADRLRQKNISKVVSRKKEISRYWNEAKSVDEFLQTLRSTGYDVARGRNGRRVVLIDKDGQPYDLARELPKIVFRNEVKEKFADVLLTTVEQAQERMKKMQDYDREQDTIDRENAMLDAADKAAMKQSEQSRGETTQRPQHKKTPTSKPQGHQEHPPKIKPLDPIYKKVDREMERDHILDDFRLREEEKLNAYYQTGKAHKRLEELRAKLKKHDTVKGRLTRKYQKLYEDIQNAERTLANQNMRKDEAFDALDKEVNRRREELDGAQGHDESVVNLEAEKKKRLAEEFKEKVRQREAQKKQRKRDRNHDKDHGHGL